MMEKYKEYREKWENYPKLYKVDRMPLNLDIELTTRCQLKCPMCPRTNNNIPIMNMPLEMVKKIIDEFAEKGGYALKLVYLGEPLLYPHLFEVIKYAKKKGIIDTIIATNGNLIDKKNAIGIVKSGLDFIIFSIDSSHPTIYKKIRVNGKLYKIIFGLRYLNQLKEFYGLEKPKIQIQAIPMESNKEEIESGEYHKFFEQYANTIRISPYNENYNITKPIGETPNFFCEGVYRRMTIRADGLVQICCGERKDEKIVGDINKDTIESIWNCNKFNKVRELMKERKSHLIEGCKTCPGRLH